MFSWFVRVLVEVVLERQLLVSFDDGVLVCVFWYAQNVMVIYVLGRAARVDCGQPERYE